MSALTRKLLRELWGLRTQMITITLVVACGVMVLVAAAGTYRCLRGSQDTYYREARFPDLFASVERAPDSVAQDLARVPGVAQLETRIGTELRLEIEGEPETLAGRLTTVPERLSLLVLQQGRYPLPGRAHEVVVHEAFAKAHALAPGSEVVALVEGRRERWTVVGIGLSPETIFVIQPGDLMPDERRYGVLWAGRDTAAAAAGLVGGFNEVVLTLAPGAHEVEVIRRLDDVLERYGGRGALGRNEQVSHRYLSDEIGGLEGMATTAPVIFLGVAAFLLNIVLSRLVAAQREQIASLEALGYSGGQVSRHYLWMGCALVLPGALLGVVIGGWFGRGWSELYAQYYHLPLVEYRVGIRLPAIGIISVLVAAAIGSVNPVRRTLKLAPAEAMRPPSPPMYQRSWLDRVGILARLPITARLILRSVTRFPKRRLSSAVAIAFAVAVILVGRFTADALDLIVELEFERGQQGDMTVGFRRPLDRRALFALEREPDVLAVEGYHGLPIELSSVGGHKRLSLQVQGPKGELRPLFDIAGNRVRIPPRGLLISRELGKILGLRAGDRARLEVLIGEQRVSLVPVVAVIDDMVGLNVYASFDELEALSGEARSFTGAWLSLGDGVRAEQAVRDRFRVMPEVAAVRSTRALMENFEKTTAEFMGLFTGIMLAFAAAIAVGVVYNSARVALAEQQRELGSLRVLGYSSREVSMVLLGQLLVELALGIPIGLVLGHFLSLLIAMAAPSDMYRMPVVFSVKSYVLAVLGVGLAGVASALVVRRRLDSLDLVSVLKAKE